MQAISFGFIEKIMNDAHLQDYHAYTSIPLCNILSENVLTGEETIWYGNYII